MLYTINLQFHSRKVTPAIQSSVKSKSGLLMVHKLFLGYNRLSISPVAVVSYYILGEKKEKKSDLFYSKRKFRKSIQIFLIVS